jgi:hypothetical protein
MNDALTNMANSFDVDLITKLGPLFADVDLEIREAARKNGPFNSAHEAYAVMLEEVDELWDEVKKKRVNRDHAAMRAEAIQVAASALRFIVDICEVK